MMKVRTWLITLLLALVIALFQQDHQLLLYKKDNQFALGTAPVNAKSVSTDGPLYCDSTPIHKSGTITANEVWDGHIYIIDSDVTVNAGITLTIRPGVVIKVNYSAGLYVNGKLLAEGTETNPVYFTSLKDDSLCGDTNGDGGATTPATGDWGWIEFRSGSNPDSVIRRAVIRYGGHRYRSPYHYWQGVIRLNNVSPALENITLAGNYRNGAELVGNWTTNVLSSTSVIYLLRERVAVGVLHTLTILPGVKIKGENHPSDYGEEGANGALHIDGKLIANGTEASPIVFTSVRDDSVCGTGAANEPICDTNNDGPSIGAAGDWGWIEFGSGSDPSSVIRRAVIRYGGSKKLGYSWYWQGVIRLNNVSPTLENITLAGNYRNGAELVGNWTTNVLSSTSVIYLLRADTAIGALHTLTILPGVKIKGENASLYVNGKIVADGTKVAPIVFTSVKDDSVCGIGAADEPVCDANNDGPSVGATGDWGWIEFTSGSDPSSVIRRAVIRYGGDRYYSYSHHWQGVIRLNNILPTLENITFAGNYRNGAELVGNWTTDVLSSTTVVYLLRNDVTLVAPHTLTILPGVKLKAENASLYINGKMVADGTETAPIVFTSVKDDAVCGIGAADEPVCDTNNDGPSVGATGDWGWIEFSADSDPNSVIRYAVIRYGGDRYYDWSHHWRGAVRLNNVSPTIAYVLFKANYRGLESLSGARPTLMCNDFVGNKDYGLYNNQPSTVVVAEGQWWNSVSGPTHPSNPKGSGDRVSNGVDFDPWSKSPCTYYFLNFRVYLPFVLRMK